MSLLRITLVLGALEAFGPLSMDLYLPQLPQLARTLDTSDALAQATMSVCMIGLGVGQLIAGPLSDRFGRKRPLLVGVALFALLSVVCAMAPTVEVLLAARFLQGLARAAGMVISMAVARDLFHGVELSRMLSLLALVTSLTPIIAPIIGGQLARFMDWRGIFFVLAGVGVVLLVVAQLGLRESLSENGRHSGSVFGTTVSHASVVLRDPLFVALMIAVCFGGAAFFSYLSMSSFVLQGQFGLTPQLFSLVFAMNAIAQLGGAQLSRLLVRRLGTARMYLTGQLAGGIAALVLLLGAPAVAFIALLAIYLRNRRDRRPQRHRARARLPRRSSGNRVGAARHGDVHGGCRGRAHHLCARGHLGEHDGGEHRRGIERCRAHRAVRGAPPRAAGRSRSRRPGDDCSRADNPATEIIKRQQR